MFILGVCAAAALAEDPVFVGTQTPAPKAEKPEGLLSSELGGTNAAGNTSYYTLTGGLNGSYKWSHNQVGLVVGALFGRGRVDTDANGSLDATEQAAPPVETARHLGVDLRYDRFFGEINSLYGLAGLLVDPFAGYDLRTHEQVGYSHIFVQHDKFHLTGELGFDWAQENYVDGVAPNSAQVYAAREMGSFLSTPNANFALSEQLELYENVVDVNDVRLVNTASIVAKLNDVFAFKLADAVAYDNVPVEGFQKLDNTTTVSLVATFFGKKAEPTPPAPPACPETPAVPPVPPATGIPETPAPG